MYGLAGCCNQRQRPRAPDGISAQEFIAFASAPVDSEDVASEESSEPATDEPIDVRDVDGEAASDLPALPPRYEMWYGGVYTRSGWAIYSGAQSAIFPYDLLHEDGWRIRVTGGYGKYRYAGTRWTGQVAENVEFNAQAAGGDALIGYQMTRGPMTLKMFVGLSTLADYVLPLDPDNPNQGMDYGVKGALDVWLNLPAQSWLAVNASLSSARNDFGLDVKVGKAVGYGFSTGIEIGVNGTSHGVSGKGGGLLRYQWSGGEASASVGISGDAANIGRWADGSDGVYGSLNWLLKY